MKFKKIQFLPLLIIAIFSACTADINNNSTPNILNQFSISSKQETGFSFDAMTTVNDTLNTAVTDFTVLPQLNDSGKLVLPILVQLQLKSNFILSKQFDNLNDAQKYFDSYTAFSENASNFSIYGLTVKPYQVWIVRTNLNKYGKILILTSTTNYLNNSPYAEITFKAELLK